MAEERVGIIRACIRYMMFWNWRKARYILRAADEQFTGSVGGIEDAFGMHKDKLVTEFLKLRNAVAEVENVIQMRRDRLNVLNAEEEDLITQRGGALAKFEEAQSTGDDEALKQHKAAFERFQARIGEIESIEERLTQEIEDASGTLERHMLTLTDMQGRIERLPEEKAQAIADFVSANTIIELNDRLSGIQTSIDSGPIDAVLEKTKKLTAEARISEKLAGADVRVQDQEYAQAGRSSTAGDAMQKMLAARKAERDAKEGKAVTEEKEDRPKI